MTNYDTISSRDILYKAIEGRHSVRHYQSAPIAEETVSILKEKIKECNKLADLNIQLVLNETKAFSGLKSYGQFSGVENYIVMAGKKSPDLDERIGYYGELLVLLSESLGLSTCWVGLTYKKVKEVYQLESGEKICCIISLGYGEKVWHKHKIKAISEVSNADSTTPAWFIDGVKAALLAPTAVNQQKFFFQYQKPEFEGQKSRVKAKKGFSIVGYTEIDLGIAKLHFELGAGNENFTWI